MREGDRRGERNAGAEPGMPMEEMKRLSVAAVSGSEADLREALRRVAQKGWRAEELPFPYGEDPLHAAAAGGRADFVEFLLEAGWSPNKKDSVSVSAAQRAARSGKRECLRILLEWGADPNGRDQWGETPGHDGASGGHLGILSLLGGAGADFSLKSGSGKTPEEYAREAGFGA